jgi:N-terminal EH-domain containing protein
MADGGGSIRNVTAGVTDVKIEVGNEDRAALISARLKQIYNKSILPVEKKYRYDYFFDSPLLSDVEFDGTFHSDGFAKKLCWNPFH